MPFDKPAPDLAKILVAWQKWEKGEEQPGRTLASLKTAGLDAVLANAGFAICGLALISHYIDDGRVSLPFPIDTGAWTEHAFQASFGNDALVRPQVRRFKTWLLAESALTNKWLMERTARA